MMPGPGHWIWMPAAPRWTPLLADVLPEPELANTWLASPWLLAPLGLVVLGTLLLGALFLWTQPVMKVLAWLVFNLFYRLRYFGWEQFPATGGAVVVSNHVSWIDGFLLLLASPRPIRMVAWEGNFTNPILRYLALNGGMILLGTRPKELLRSLHAARDAIQAGEVVVLFAEGGITRTGQVQSFRPGLAKILEGTQAPVIPVYLDGLWGSIFSFSGGGFFLKWPSRWPYPVSIHAGPPLADGSDVTKVRQAVMELGAQAVRDRSESALRLPQLFVRNCQRRLFVSKVADSVGNDLTGGELLARTLILRALLNRGTLGPDESFVGLLLPPSTAAVVTNAALALDRRIAVNLNYTVSSEVMNDCIRQCGIKHVLTSRKFMEKMDFNLEAEVVYLEDFKELPTWFDKLIAGLQAYLLPASLLEWWFGLGAVPADDVMTIIFTSGSTGSPKGVMLTYANVNSNTEAIDQVVRLSKEDVIIGILPFFHSFGFTVTLWTVLGLDIKGVYHFSPLDARQIGKLCQEHGGTILLSTPTFLRTYARRCTEEEFKTLDVVVAGAEKLPGDLCDQFEQKFGVRPVEGYGTTELSPLVSVNVPPSRSTGNFQVDRKEGSVGRPVPGVAVKIVHRETGEEMPTGEAGLLLVSGPNVMKGYLHRPEATAAVLQEGWYSTGDVAYVDSDGFIFITGRESRFSKIGGEMVPHVLIEETLNRILARPDDESLQAVVTAVPDEKKGERLVVIHLKIDRTPAELNEALSAAGLPNLFIPGADSYLEVAELPVLGTGKTDLRALKQLALDKFGPQHAPAK